ncbi:MAG: hypothetical protein M1136_00795 [Chloroflexi bacterium]|nr:hypothetical protein [Chloroflexota bacterium]
MSREPPDYRRPGAAIIQSEVLPIHVQSSPEGDSDTAGMVSLAEGVGLSCGETD